MKKKILIVFGTRPEAIKMAPLVYQFNKHSAHFITKVCVTAQHRQMLDNVLDFFEIKPDFDLNLMKPNQSLEQLTADVITGMSGVFDVFKPDYVLVHGDTTTSFAAALASFYAGIKICHVEAGLRTYNKQSPFPEELNRQLTARLTDIHFAPTIEAQHNLQKEYLPNSEIIVTGNTVIDALNYAVNKLDTYQNDEISLLQKELNFDKKVILVTGHRRENFGDGFIQICEALKYISDTRSDVEIVYPVHLNPNVKNVVYPILSSSENIKLINPLGYPAFVWLMNKSYLILTDSGGIQEEAPSLGKPVLVMRETTERPEALNAGTVLLVGTDKNKMISTIENLLNETELYRKMSDAHNPYGDGHASARIVNHILSIS